MTKYRDNLPQLSNRPVLTDGGIETTLIFLEGLDLPYFAAFDLMKHAEGQAALRKYFGTYAALAKRFEVDCILESATWRASTDWGAKLNYSVDSIMEINRQSVAMLHEIRRDYETDKTRVVISGCIGPRGDGYNPSNRMSIDEAEPYHAMQAQAFREAGADLLTAITMNYVEEAIGITRAAQAAEMPVVISFTVETDGRLPTGQTLQQAIEQVDAATNNGPVYYMLNCAHPVHFTDMLLAGGDWTKRLRGLRANASARSHAELDNATDLDDGNPHELGQQYLHLHRSLNTINVFGGCCGTDDRHIEEIFKAVLS